MSVSSCTVAFDCGDAAKLAQFWSEALSRQVAPGASEEFATLEPAASGPGMVFCKVPEAKVAKNRVHLDLTVTSLDDEVTRIAALGAREVTRYDEDGSRWVTLTDPEGNEFDLIAA